MRARVLLLLCIQLGLCCAAYGAGAGLQSGSANGPSGQREGARIEGAWQGTLVSAAGRLRLVLKVSRSAEGVFTATLDSLDQGAKDLPVDVFVFNDSYVRFEMKAIQASFDGGLSRDGTEIAGAFRQGLLSPLVLTRASDRSAIPPPPTGFTRGRASFAPCNLPALTKDAGCGKHEVFEDRAAKSGRKLALNILILPALAQKPAPDPVFVLAGGPGQGAASLPKNVDYLVKLRRDRDLVFIDQRGTGESNPLMCNIPAINEGMGGYFTERLTAENVRECRAALEQKAKLESYTSSIAMEDLDEVRAALGYDKINLMGGSYGTFAGLVYLREHADHVRAAMLEGVSPVEAKIYLPFAKGVEHSLERMFSDCAADKECGAAFPNLRAELKEVAARLEKQPASFEAANLINGKREPVTLSRAMFGEQVRTLLYIPIYWRWLPLLIHEASKGNFAPFASIAYVNLRSLSAPLAIGMSLSVICAEDIPFITEEEIQRETAGAFYGDYRIRTGIKACENWPRGKVAPKFSEPVKSTIPILMISGDLDPVAPPWAAAGALRFLPNGRQVTIPNTGHYFRFECVDDLLAEFLSKGSAKGLDDSCAKGIERPPFITSLPPQLAK